MCDFRHCTCTVFVALCAGDTPAGPAQPEPRGHPAQHVAALRDARAHRQPRGARGAGVHAAAVERGDRDAHQLPDVPTARLLALAGRRVGRESVCSALTY